MYTCIHTEKHTHTHTYAVKYDSFTCRKKFSTVTTWIKLEYIVLVKADRKGNIV